jgi:hypothetical protein
VKRVKRVSRAPKKTHNTALSAKVNLRRWLVQELGGQPNIIDCFCAAGMLWDRAYDKTPNYLGLDIRQFDDARRTIVCDSKRFLRHADVRLEDFDLFDLDAFGSPMEHLAIICSRIRLEPGRRVGFVLTDGTGFNARMNGTPKGLLKFVGVSPHKRTSVQSDFRDEIAARAVAKCLAIAGLKSLEAKRAQVGEAGAAMRYAAILAEAT